MASELQASQQKTAELSTEHSKLGLALKAETARADRALQEVTDTATIFCGFEGSQVHSTM